MSSLLVDTIGLHTTIQHPTCHEGIADCRAKEAVFPEQGWLEGGLFAFGQNHVTSDFFHCTYDPEACVINREVHILIEGRTIDKAIVISCVWQWLA